MNKTTKFKVVQAIVRMVTCKKEILIAKSNLREVFNRLPSTNDLHIPFQPPLPNSWKLYPKNSIAPNLKKSSIPLVIINLMHHMVKWTISITF